MPANASSIELYQAVPSAFRWVEGRSVEVDVLATSGIKVEALAVLPLALELPPPPPEPWSRQPDNAPE